MTGNAVLFSHLQGKHKHEWDNFVKGHPQYGNKKRKSPQDAALMTAPEADRKVPRTIDGLFSTISGDELDIATTRFFVVHSIAHVVANSPEFKEMIRVAKKSATPPPNRVRLR